MNRLPALITMRRAYQAKDSRYDGVFFVAVKTTHIFCRPVCRSKTPRPENVEFYATPHEALFHGFRPCKRCRPLDAGQRPPRVVERLMHAVEHARGQRLSGKDLRAMGIDPSTARRHFKAYCGMTFQAYQRGRRMGQAMAALHGAKHVSAAQAASGYVSPSGFREAFARLFGTAPSSAASTGAAPHLLTSTWVETPLGAMLAVCDDTGVRLLDFVDRRGLENAVLRLRKRLGAVIVPGEHALLACVRAQLAEYFAGKRLAFDLPLAPLGTPFQQAAWAYLRTIPIGETRSYLDMARAIGDAKAVRAVAQANGMNYVALVIPCHRVIGADGSLTGYGGGLARKRWLIDHELAVATQLAPTARARAGSRALQRSLALDAA